MTGVCHPQHQACAFYQTDDPTFRRVAPIPRLSVTVTPQSDLLAAVDLGSNSFHLLVASHRNGSLTVVDRLVEMVRLGAGLDAQNNLTPEAQIRALECLERFGQRLRNLPPCSVRAVGTNTFRMAQNAQPFLHRAEHALGHQIEIVSGIEEARLIYQGVARSLAPDGTRRLVMDIGGGSTEFIIGVDQEPLHKESFRMGCVSMSLRHFPGGKISAKRFKRAVIAAQRELEPIELAFRRGQWSEAVGASGSLRAIQKIILAAGWSKEGISSTGLERLAEGMIAAGDVAKLQFPELNPERAPVLPGGVVIVYAAFKILGIELMKVADGALREGLLYDLVGRLHHTDIRSTTVDTLATRYHVDREHADRVRQSAREFAQQALAKETVDLATVEQWLGWAAELHEIGFDIAHSAYHKHGAYIVENADLPGFSQQEQKLLATLVRAHRRKFPIKLFRELAHPWDELAPRIAIALRLGVLLNRSRHPAPLPAIELQLHDGQVTLRFPDGWLADHPLTMADLEQEAEVLQVAGLALRFA